MHHTALKSAALILSLFFTSTAYGEQDTVPDFSCDPGVESGSNFAFGGKPVSLVSGAETFSRTDLSLGSLYPIIVQRRYNSRSGYDSPPRLRLGLKLRQANLHLSRRLRHAQEGMRLEDPLLLGAPPATFRPQERPAASSRTLTAPSFTLTKAGKRKPTTPGQAHEHG